MLRFANIDAVTGSALIALALVVITTRPATTSTLSSRGANPALTNQYSRVKSLWAEGNYAYAGELAITIANDAEHVQDNEYAAKSWRVAGDASLIELRLRDALSRYMRALKFAKLSRNPVIILNSYTSLASLYLQLEDPASALHYAQLGLAAAPVHGQGRNTAVLQLLVARSTAKIKPFAEALPLYRASLATFDKAETDPKLQMTITAWDLFGGDALKAGRLDVAESALDRAIFLAEMHQGRDLTSIFRKLAKLRDMQGDSRSAAALYASAQAAPPDLTPPWLLFADRGEFRLGHGDNQGALADFREARSLVKRLRADVVPNDQGRVSLENGLSRISNGFIDAGNRLGKFDETFEAAEQSRTASLAALTPERDDWRANLPPAYWDLLSRYRRLSHAAGSEGQEETLQLEISQMEAAAFGNTRDISTAALPHIQSNLGPNDAFLGFHTGERTSWLWVVMGRSVQTIELPRQAEIEKAVQAFRQAVRETAGFESAGRQLFELLFGKVSARALAARRWLVSLDGPLYDLPLPALVLPQSLPGKPVFLCERVALQLAPGASMLRKGRSLSGGSFIGIADPIYNGADSRYHGKRPESTLPRLPASQRELAAAAEEWGPSRSRVLLGQETNLENVISAAKSSPAILHFATHIVPGSGEYQSGLIALGLRRDGHMDLLGPMDILSRRLEADLVVLNGCHSGQAQTIPGSGLMGLTRAWIGAGANAVLATQWDVADGDSQSLLIQFYRSIKENSDENIAFSLQRAWIKVLQKQEARNKPATWAAYFLLART